MGLDVLVLFDIDGTLLRSGGSGRRAMSQAAGELFGRPDMFDDLSFAGAVDSLIVAEAIRHCGIEPTPRRMGRMKARYVRRLTRDLNSSKGVVLPGVDAAVAALKQRAYVGLLTGHWELSARVKLETHGLGDTFAGCVGAYGSDANDRNALIPFALRRALRRWPPVGRVIVIGDTPADVECARAGQTLVGSSGPEVLAVAVETGFASPDALRSCKPDLQLADLDQGLSELLGLL